MNINSLRENINTIDSQIYDLLLQRYRNVIQIGLLKKENNLNILDNKREELIYNNINSLNINNSEKYYIKSIYIHILNLSKFIQK